MNKTNKKFFGIGLRYCILILLAIPNLFLFYFIFTPLTTYPVYFLINLFFNATLLMGGTIILVEQTFPIELIPACIAGAAYYLLLIINLSTPDIKIKKRLTMIGFSFLTLLVLNILRIFFLSLLVFSGSDLFDITHKIFWYGVSTIFVVGIWFWQVKKFKIKEIPLYSDLKFLYKNSIKKF